MKQKDRVVAAILAAEEVCPRVETERTRQSISSEMEKLKRMIERECPQVEEQERVTSEYLAAMDQYEKTQTLIQNQTDALKVRASGEQATALVQRGY